MLIQRYQSPRNGRYDDAEVLAVTIRNALARCQEIVNGHIIEVWQVIQTVIHRLATGRPGMSSTIMYVVLNDTSQWLTQ